MTRLDIPRLNRLARLAALALMVPVVFSMTGCEETPDTRLEAFRTAADDKELPAYTEFFTKRSAAFIRGVVAVRERTNLKYLTKVFELVPAGDVEESLVDGNMAILTVNDGSKTNKIRMLKEDGQWLIDIMDDDKIWAPISPRDAR